MAEILKFKCERCGQRIAMQPRHLNKLVTCPECGQPTHPLAEQFVSVREQALPPQPGRATAESAKTAPAAPDRSCANCGQTIGRLQKVQLWENEVVCAPCHKRLSMEASRAGMAAIREAPPGQNAGAGNSPKSRRKAKPPPAEPEHVEVQRVDVVDTPAAPAPAAPHHALVKAAAFTLNLTGRPSPDSGAGLRTIPLTWGTTWAALRGRLLGLLLVICVLAAATYGAMSLLRDIAGLIAAVAFIMLAAVVTWLLLRATLQAGKRLVASRTKSAGSTETDAKRSDHKLPNANLSDAPDAALARRD